MPNTRVYIDGFNLYHGVIQENRYHWLNLESFARKLNKGEAVERIIYCTAMVASSPIDPEKAQRQEAYHPALGVACPTVEILRGNFSTQRKHYALAGCLNDPTCCVKVVVRTEKGSDVNLAARLLHDAHMGRFDRAIVVSGDSDLVEPIRLVTQEVGKVVWVRNPRKIKSSELGAVASHYDFIPPGLLRFSQLPLKVTGTGGKEYSKPAKWSQPLPVHTKTVILSAPCPQAGCTKSVSTCRFGS